MKLRIGKPSCVISWIVTAALITSPLLAQNSAATDVGVSAPEDVANDSAAPVSTENHEALVDTSVLPARPIPTGRAAVPVVNKNSIPIPARTAAMYPPRRSSNAPGETKWVILAALLAAGAVTALLLIHGGDGDSNHHPGTQGTIIVAGNPAVSNH
jgi:hypothetical protein